MIHDLAIRAGLHESNLKEDGRSFLSPLLPALVHDLPLTGWNAPRVCAMASGRCN